MVKTTDVMERKGLIRRVRNKADRRQFTLVPTAEGKALVHWAATHREEITAAVFSPATKDQLEEARKGAQAIVEQG